MQHELPTRPWQIVGTYLFAIRHNTYLLVCDYYSKFPFVYKMEGKVTSDAIVERLKDVFAENGSPDKVISDNGGHYISLAFRTFAEEWCFDHTTSSPHYPQSNGFIERQVQTVKNVLKKATMTKSDPKKALLILRSTPIDSHLPSPVEMLNARKYKSNLPIVIRNENWSRDDINRRLADRQEIRVNHDRRANRPLAPLIPEQDVRIRDHRTETWQPAKVVTTCEEPRSYQVMTPNGNVLRRNRRHLRETAERHDALARDHVDLRTDEPDDLTIRDDLTKQTRTPVRTPETVTITSPPSPHVKKTVRFQMDEQVPSPNINSSPQQRPEVTTRSGRRVKPPRRLDL